MAFEIAERAEAQSRATSAAYLSVPPKERDHRARWRREAEDRKAFAQDLAAEYADGLPEALQEKVFEKAWDDSHSSGFQSVENTYEEYADFARFAREA